MPMQMPRASFAAGGGTSKQSNFSGSVQDAFNQSLNALTQTNSTSKGTIMSQVTWQQPPQAARFEMVCKSLWATLGFPIKYDGEIQIQASGQNQVAARFNLKANWGSAMGLIITQAAVAVFAIMLNPYYGSFALFLVLGSIGFTAWNVSTGMPDKALEQIFTNLQGGGAAAAVPQTPAQPAATYSYVPQPQPPSTPTPQTPPTPASSGGEASAIMEQIKQLGSLRDAGVLTTEEFETKKAELLKRI